MFSDEKIREAQFATLALALRCIAEMPIPQQDNMISANMRRIAQEALKSLETR